MREGQEAMNGVLIAETYRKCNKNRAYHLFRGVTRSLGQKKPKFEFVEDVLVVLGQGVLGTL